MLSKLHSELRGARRMGRARLALPLPLVLFCKARLKPGKQGGRDGVVSEMLMSMSFSEVFKLREAFQRRLNDDGSDPVEEITSWKK
eukprot:8511966-Alexandrium_andersonii.AAC.1